MRSRVIALRAVLLLAPAALAAPSASATDGIRPAARAIVIEPHAAVPADPALTSLVDGMDARWLRRRALVARGDRSGAEEIEKDLAATLRDENIGRLPSLARAALLDGQRELRRGSVQSAIETFRLARTFDPLLAEAHWAEALARRRAGESLGRVVPLAAKAVSARWNSYWPRYRDLLGLAVVTLGALLAAGAASILTLVVAHGPVLVHEVEERLPASWHGAWRRALGSALVLAPFAVQWVGAFALVLWSVVLVPAGTRGERRLVYLWLGLLAIAVPVGNALWAMSALPASPQAQVAVAAAEGAVDPTLVPGLEALAASRPREATWKVLAARAVAPREAERALTLLREAAAIDPHDARISIALGNIYFRQGKRETAAVFYRQAAEQDATSVLALYNLSRVRAMMLDTRQAEEALQQARAIDAQQVRLLERRLVGDAVGDPVYTRGEITRDVATKDALTSAREALDLLNPVSLAALAALLAAVLVGVRGRDYDARRCPRCGEGFCDRCPGQERGSDVCTACAQLFMRREGLSPVARQAQAARVDRRIRLVGRGRALAQILWPGLALVHEGRVALGLLQAFSWAFCLGGAFVAPRLLPPGPPAGPWTPGLPYLVAAVLVWLLAQLPALRPAPIGRGR